MKRLLSSLLAIFLFTPLMSGIVHAADAPQAESPSMSDFETRQLVLEKIFKLTEEEIGDLRLRLENLDRPTDEVFGLVYDTLKANLKDHLQFIESRIKELNSSYTTLDGVRVTADSFKKWRETVYDPGTREIFDFLVVRQGETIFAITEARYQKVVSDVEKLKLSLDDVKVASLQTLLADATKHLENARLLRDASEALFLKTFRAGRPELDYKFDKIAAKQAAALTASVVESALPNTSPAPVVKSKTILDTLDLSKETVQTLMQKAVAEIAAAYQDFIQMRSVVHAE